MKWMAWMVASWAALSGCHSENSIDRSCVFQEVDIQGLAANMIVVVDTSASMGDASDGGDTAYRGKWMPLKEALKAFFGDSGASGINASLDFMPSPGDYGTGACSVEEYRPPKVAVPLEPLPGTGATFDMALDAVVPSGGTPTSAALQGSLEYAAEVAARDPQTETSVVLITDGLPGFTRTSDTGIPETIAGCSGNDIPSIAELVRARFASPLGQPSIRTHVLGLAATSDELADLSVIAQAGGTGLVPIVADGDPERLRAALDTQLINVRRRALGCTFPIPPVPDGSTRDPVFIDLGFDSGSHYVPTYTDDCSSFSGEGYRFDDPEAPTRFVMCPGLCERFAVARNKAVAEFGCDDYDG